MKDRGKVIKGIRKCLSHKPCGENGCPYENECAVEHLNDPLLRDALALLKEQETADTGSCRVFQCEKCGYGIDDIFVADEGKYQIVPRFCPNCGRKVKLE